MPNPSVWKHACHFEGLVLIDNISLYLLAKAIMIRCRFFDNILYRFSDETACQLVGRPQCSLCYPIHGQRHEKL